MPPRRALVTGASGGIGLELATLLARDEHDLVLVARSADKLAAAAADLTARFGIAVQTIAQDLAAHGAARAVFTAAGPCDVLVNNAGFATYGPTDGRIEPVRAAYARHEISRAVIERDG